MRVLDGEAYILIDLDGTRLEGSYAGNRLKRYWAQVPAEIEDEDEDIPASDKSVEPGIGICKNAIVLASYTVNFLVYFIHISFIRRVIFILSS